MLFKVFLLPIEIGREERRKGERGRENSLNFYNFTLLGIHTLILKPIPKLSHHGKT